jgi:hypothetical protein
MQASSNTDRHEMARHDWALRVVYRLICVCATDHCSIGEWGKRRSFIRSMEQQDGAMDWYGTVLGEQAVDRRSGSGSGTICSHDALCEVMIP